MRFPYDSRSDIKPEAYTDPVGILLTHEALCATVRDKGEGSVAATREPIIREKLGKTHRNNYEAGYTHENTVAT
jgi:hypothetical protein